MLHARQPVAGEASDIAWIGEAQARRIRVGFESVAADADGFAAEFYDTLFGIAPALRPLFRGDMAEQRVKLLRMLALLVNNLERAELLRDALRKLGERHQGYGVVERDFHPVGLALLTTLSSRLGIDFTVEDRRAWADLYVRVVAMMQGREQP